MALLLDEFAQVGRIPKFPNTIAVARGRGVSLVLGIQSLAQLDALYGKAGAEVVRTNCCTRVDRSSQGCFSASRPPFGTALDLTAGC